MKYKTTKREVNAGYTTRICVGYCYLQTLLSYEEPVSYTERPEGWGADIYAFGETAIVTGYDPFGNVHADYDLCMKYDKEARKIRRNYELSFEEQNEGLQVLIRRFIAEAKNDPESSDLLIDRLTEKSEEAK